MCLAVYGWNCSLGSLRILIQSFQERVDFRIAPTKRSDRPAKHQPQPQPCWARWHGINNAGKRGGQQYLCCQSLDIRYTGSGVALELIFMKRLWARTGSFFRIPVFEGQVSALPVFAMIVSYKPWRAKLKSRKTIWQKMKQWANFPYPLVRSTAYFEISADKS